jgi:hypothetical protein
MCTGTAFRVLSLLGFAALAAGQTKFSINAETPWGAILQQIGQESDEGKKLALLNEFAAKYGADAARKEEMLWILPQKQAIHVKRQEWDAVVEAASTLERLDPGNQGGDNLPAFVAALKAVEAKKDPPAVRTWAVKTSALARKLASAAAADQADYGKQVDIYTEYALATAAATYAQGPAVVELGDALAQQNPASPYWAQACPAYFNALMAAKEAPKALDALEQCAARNAANEDMFIQAANHLMTAKQTPDKVVVYARQAAELSAKRAKPEGAPAADWTKRQDAIQGLGHWMAGMTLAGQNKFPDADQSLRLALPLIQGNSELLAPALFQLGLINFRLGEAKKDKVRLTDAARFSARCAAMKSPYQAQAAQNLKVIQTRFGITGK